MCSKSLSMGSIRSLKLKKFLKFGSLPLRIYIEIFPIILVCSISDCYECKDPKPQCTECASGFVATETKEQCAREYSLIKSKGYLKLNFDNFSVDFRL